MKIKNLFNFITVFICMISLTSVLAVNAKDAMIEQPYQEVIEEEYIEAENEVLPTPFPEYAVDELYIKPSGHAVRDKKIVMGQAEPNQQVVVTCNEEKITVPTDENGNYAISLEKKITKKSKISVQLLKDEKVSLAKKVKIVKKAAPTMYCKAYILIDLSSGEIISSSKKRKKIYPASTTKIMTGILALEHFKNTSKMLTASKKAVYGIGVGGSNVHTYIGEKMSVQNWLKALLISSANEAANVLAEGVSGSNKLFAEKMNLKAIEIGAYNTNFVNPSGLPKKKHYTTVEDLAIMGRYAMQLSDKSGEFRKIVAKKKAVLPKTNKHTYKRKLVSTNKLHGVPSKVYSKIIGVKTGYTNISKRNFVGCAVDNSGRKILCVVAGVYPAYGEQGIFSQCKRMLEYGFNISQGNFE